MSEPEDWVPDLICWNDFDGTWDPFIAAVYAIFRRDMIDSIPTLDGLPIRCRRDPIFDGKEAGFWHCTSEGKQEDERTPEMRRCERIAWLRAVIEHADDERVDRWSTDKRGDERHYLWFNEEYLIALGVRKKHYQLITAFHTGAEHTRRKLRKERDECQKN